MSLQFGDEDFLWDHAWCDGFLKGVKEAPACGCGCGFGCLGVLLCHSLGCVMRVPRVKDHIQCRELGGQLPWELQGGLCGGNGQSPWQVGQDLALTQRALQDQAGNWTLGHSRR